MITAVVGAGGKTSLIHALAAQYRAQGKQVFVTTSTHMYIESDTLLTDDPAEIIHALKTSGYAMAGLPQGEKIGPLSQATYEAVCPHADVVLIEADGARHKAVKLPREGEPVIYDNVEEITVVCGLHALGKTVAEAAFQPETAAEFLGVSAEEKLTPEHIQNLLQKGYVEMLHEKYPEKTVTAAPAADGSLYQRALAGLMKAGMDVSMLKREWFEKKPMLVICGGGHVALEVAEFAARLDFRIKVIDDREEFANRQRFHMAEEVICDSFDHLEQHLEPNAFYVVLTRGHAADQLCVRQILGSSYRYLGMIGSRSKVAATLQKLREDGVSEAALETIHSPIGLAIGAVTPAEIAVSILAEIIQEKNRQAEASASAELLNSTCPGTLCIIIEKNGSAPRGVGSMMLVTEEKVYDSIGGGAVEFAAIADAGTVEKAEVREYYLNNEQGAELGMICGGMNRVLLIPV